MPERREQLDHAGKKARRDFKDAVGLEAIRPRRPHVMQRENDADAADKRLERPMRAGEIERLQPAADDGLLQAGHVS